VGAVMDIVVWLRSLGLGKYEAAFRENDIDKELGVTAVGHRLKLLDFSRVLTECRKLQQVSRRHQLRAQTLDRNRDK